LERARGDSAPSASSRSASHASVVHEHARLNSVAHRSNLASDTVAFLFVSNASVHVNGRLTWPACLLIGNRLSTTRSAR
jgi:hypothetical protein